MMSPAPGRDRRRTGIRTIEFETVIRAPIGRCFDLARDPRAHVESAYGTHERLVYADGDLLSLDDEVEFEARHFGIPFRLRSRIVAFKPPTRFVDVMVRGPFEHLWHEHRFAQEVDAVRMVDRMEIVIPFGRIGDRIAGQMVADHLRAFLASRGETLRSMAEGRDTRFGPAESPRP